MADSRHFEKLLYRSFSAAVHPISMKFAVPVEVSTAFKAELSVGLFSSTQPNPTHQITDPTQPTAR